MEGREIMVDLDKEYKYFESVSDDLAKKYPHKYAVIKEEEVIGIYDTLKEALEETSKKHELGTFIVQQCEDKTHTVQRFHSRVAFA